VLRDDDLRAALIEIGDDVVAVESLAGEQRPGPDALDQRCDVDTVEAVAGHQVETHEIAQGVGERQNLGRHAIFGTADGLALSLPFAPCPHNVTDFRFGYWKPFVASAPRKYQNPSHIFATVQRSL